MMRSFWDYGHGFAFSPRVKPIGKIWDNFFSCWRIKCRVTGRDSAHKDHGCYGREVWTRDSNLYGKVRTVRGTFGRLEYSDRITYAEIDQLPIVAAD